MNPCLGISLKNLLRIWDHANESAQRETTRYSDHDSNTILEQRKECDCVQAIGKTYNDEWVKDIDGVGIGREEFPEASLTMKVCTEENQQAGAHRHTHNSFPERVEKRLPVESACKVFEMIDGSSPYCNNREE